MERPRLFGVHYEEESRHTPLVADLGVVGMNLIEAQVERLKLVWVLVEELVRIIHGR